ncbi:MAG: hypothetical protein DRN20_03485 [Thermoplasmata archaeon]|nr:MAG: hypothetical protein DRN20_03485 [Thermoplasmata archaeon]
MSKDIQIVADLVVKEILQKGEIAYIDVKYQTDWADNYERTAGISDLVSTVPYLHSLKALMRVECELPKLPKGFYFINDPKGELLLADGQKVENITEWIRSNLNFDYDWVVEAIVKELPDEHKEEIRERKDELIIEMGDMHKDKKGDIVMYIVDATL